MYVCTIWWIELNCTIGCLKWKVAFSPLFNQKPSQSPPSPIHLLWTRCISLSLSLSQIMNSFDLLFPATLVLYLDATVSLLYDPLLRTLSNGLLKSTSGLI